MPQETLIDELTRCTDTIIEDSAQRQIEELTEALYSAFACIGEMNRVLDGIVNTITAFRNRI